jgi:ethanolamine utilization protein EutA
VPRYEFIKRDISWQSPVFFTPVDKQGELKEAELEALILAQYRAAGIAPQAVDSGAIIITGESAKTRNARPAVMALSQSLGDFVVASAGPHLESVIAGHGAGAQTLSRQRMCRVLNIDIGGGTSNYALFDAGNSAPPPASTSAAACWKPTLRGAWSTRTRRDSGLSMRYSAREPMLYR